MADNPTVMFREDETLREENHYLKSRTFGDRLWSCKTMDLMSRRDTIPHFYFDYFNGNRLEEAAADDGLELPDADAAYLEAFRAATEIWGEALHARRNPIRDYFRVRDRTGTVVLELPFAEVLESNRGGPLRPPPQVGQQPWQDTIDLARRHILKGRKIVADQHNRVERLREQGRDTSKAEETLGLFTRSLAIFEDHFETLQSVQARLS
jgi:hypothetical protein